MDIELKYRARNFPEVNILNWAKAWSRAKTQKQVRHALKMLKHSVATLEGRAAMPRPPYCAGWRPMKATFLPGQRACDVDCHSTTGTVVEIPRGLDTSDGDLVAAILDAYLPTWMLNAKDLQHLPFTREQAWGFAAMCKHSEWYMWTRRTIGRPPLGFASHNALRCCHLAKRALVLPSPTKETP